MIVVAIIVVYSPAIRAGFIWDDDAILTKNFFVRIPFGLFYIWCSTQLPDYFPLTWSSFWLEWRIWGANPMGYHVTNILLHAISALLLWRALRRLRVRGAWVAALVFAVHPVHVQSVAWIAERKNTLAMFFYLLSFYSFTRVKGESEVSSREQPARQAIYYWLSFGFFTAALLSKTAVVTFPLVLLGLAWWQRGKIVWEDVRRTLPFFAASLLLGLVTVWFQAHRAIGGEAIRTDDFLTRLMSAGKAFWFYFAKVLWPINLSFVYPEWTVNKDRLIWYLPMAAVVFVVATLWLLRKRIGRAPLFAFTYFLLMLLPILGFVNVYFMRYTLVSDHWAYFADTGLIVFAIGSGAWMFCNFRAGIRWILPVMAAAIIAWFGMLTFRQAGTYHDLGTLWRATLEKNPQSWLAHNGLAAVLTATGDFENARVHYLKAAAIKADSAEVQNNCGSALLELRRPEEAIAYIRKALAINPSLAVCYYNLGNAFDQLNKPAEAETNFLRAIELDPSYAEAHCNVGVLLYSMGKKQQALEHFEHAVSVRPDYVDALNNLGTLFLEMGKPREAQSQLRRAVQLDPNNADANFNLGNVLLTQGSADEAVKSYRQAIAVRPDMAAAHCRLGVAIWKDGKGNAEAAIQELDRALKLNANDPEAYYYAGIIMSANKQTADAIRLLRRAVELRPEWPEAHAGLAFSLATAARAIDRDAEEALAHATRAATLSGNTNYVVLDALAAAYATNNRFEDASTVALKAADLADNAGAKALAEKIRSRRAVYLSGQPYRE